MQALVNETITQGQDAVDPDALATWAATTVPPP